MLQYSTENIHLLSNYYRQKMKDGDGQHIDLTNSYARLNDPFGQKIGGGHRVRSIEIHDNWGEMTTTGTSTFYAPDYNYESSEDGIISSGVAS